MCWGISWPMLQQVNGIAQAVLCIVKLLCMSVTSQSLRNTAGK